MAPSPEHDRPHNGEQSLPETGHSQSDLPGAQAEQQPHDGGINKPELHSAQVEGEIFHRDESALFEQHEPQDLIEGVPQELPKAPDPETPEQRRRQQHNETTRQYYRRLYEREAQGDPEAKELLDRRRASVRDARYRWNKQHPEKHRAEVTQWQKSPKGREYKREYMRQWRQNKKKQQDNEDT